MDANNSQTRGGRAAGRPIGAPNYNNNILIQVVELYLPQGLASGDGATDDDVDEDGDGDGATVRRTTTATATA